MDHPFKVGNSYENNDGAYTVLDISPPNMLIRYADGSKKTVTIRIQNRIWRRIQTEREVAHRERAKKVRAARAANTFDGFDESDFKDNVAGTHWRSRPHLGGLVAQQLCDARGVAFRSVAVPRQPRFFVSPPHLPMDNQEEAVKLPKFEVRLDAERLRYSFHVEKSDRVMGSDWYWPHFLELLSEPSWQESLAAVMAERDLHWLLHFEEGQGASGQPLPARTMRISPSFGDDAPFASFAEFAAHLHKLPPRQWCNLYIARVMPKDEAIALGAKVSQRISQTFSALTPMYLRLLR